MRKAKLMLMLLAVLLVGAALPPATQAWECEILCWDYGTQYCWQDSRCGYHCCNVGDPGCSTPCW